jgi:hypothetical protein
MQVDRPKVDRLKVERLKVDRLKVERLKVDRLKVERLKVERLKEKTCAITQSQDRLDTLAGDCVMDDRFCPSVFSLNT